MVLFGWLLSESKYWVLQPVAAAHSDCKYTEYRMLNAETTSYTLDMCFVSTHPFF